MFNNSHSKSDYMDIQQSQSNPDKFRVLIDIDRFREYLITNKNMPEDIKKEEFFKYIGKYVEETVNQGGAIINTLLIIDKLSLKQVVEISY